MVVMWALCTLHCIFVKPEGDHGNIVYYHFTKWMHYEMYLLGHYSQSNRDGLQAQRLRRYWSLVNMMKL